MPDTVQAWSSSKRKLDPRAWTPGLKRDRFLADPEGADRLAASSQCEMESRIGPPSSRRLFSGAFEFALPVSPARFSG